MRFINIVCLVISLGLLSNLIGGFIGYFGGGIAKKNINNLISFTAGMMTSIVCFELLQEAFKISGIYFISFFVLVGVIFIAAIDKSLSSKKIPVASSFIIIIAMGAHNITEGLAIGSAFDISLKLGISLMTAIFLHNIPEGMIIGITQKKERKKFINNIIACFCISIFFGFGSGIGYLAGSISKTYISICLALSAGAMLYIVACDLIPEMSQNKKDKKVGIIYIIGIIIGMIISSI